MYGIMVRNTGMWGFTTWLSEGGEIMKFRTLQEASKYAEMLNHSRGSINNFTHYFASKIS